MTATGGAFYLRTATETDAEGIDQLLTECYPRLMSPAYPSDVMAATLPVMTRSSPVLLRSGRFYVAIADRQIVGCGGWSAERPGTRIAEPGTAHIRHFATDPKWLGRGIGRCVFNLALAAAQEQQFATMECYSSVNAQGFYAALGFAVLRKRHVSIGNVELAVVHMRRSMSACQTAR